MGAIFPLVHNVAQPLVLEDSRSYLATPPLGEEVDSGHKCGQQSRHSHMSDWLVRDSTLPPTLWPIEQVVQQQLRQQRTSCLLDLTLYLLQ